MLQSRPKEHFYRILKDISCTCQIFQKKRFLYELKYLITYLKKKSIFSWIRKNTILQWYLSTLDLLFCSRLYMCHPVNIRMEDFLSSLVPTSIRLTNNILSPKSFFLAFSVKRGINPSWQSDATSNSTKKYREMESRTLVKEHFLHF